MIFPLCRPVARELLSRERVIEYILSLSLIAESMRERERTRIKMEDDA